MPIEFDTTERVEVLDVTERVADAVEPVECGACTAFCPHTTAGVVVNESERGLLHDLEAALERLLPRGAGYEHDTVDGNADAHLRAMLLGESVTVPVVDGSLALGTWQSVRFVEGDGPRRRQLELVTTAATGRS